MFAARALGDGEGDAELVGVAVAGLVADGDWDPDAELLGPVWAELSRAFCAHYDACDAVFAACYGGGGLEPAPAAVRAIFAAWASVPSAKKG